MKKAIPRSEPTILSVTLGPSIGLDRARRSLNLLRGGLAVLNALAHVAGQCEEDTVDIDWAGVEYLTKELETELGSGTFDSLEMAVHEAIEAEREARDGGAR